MSESKLSLALIRLLRVTICPMCGNRKVSGQCFCKTCYFGLTAPQRNLLYTRLDEGNGEFEEHYLRAMRTLKDKSYARKLTEWPIEARRIIEETGLIDVLVERNRKVHHGDTEARS